MFLKIFTIFTIFAVFSVVTKASLFFDSVAVGKTFTFDFGEDVQSLQINRDEGDEEILYAGKEGTHSNIKLSKKGILTISPVTEKDFGMYASKTKKETNFDNGVFIVAPLTLHLTKKE